MYHQNLLLMFTCVCSRKGLIHYSFPCRCCSIYASDSTSCLNGRCCTCFCRSLCVVAVVTSCGHSLHLEETLATRWYEPHIFPLSFSFLLGKGKEKKRKMIIFRAASSNILNLLNCLLQCDHECFHILSCHKLMEVKTELWHQMAHCSRRGCMVSSWHTVSHSQYRSRILYFKRPVFFRHLKKTISYN